MDLSTESLVLSSFLLNGIPIGELQSLNKIEINNVAYLKSLLTKEARQFIANTRTINANLYSCTDSQWVIIRTISKELKYNNLIWKNESLLLPKYRESLKFFVDKGVLTKSSTKHYYIVHPAYIRFGEYYNSITHTRNIIVGGIENKHLISGVK